MNMLIKRITQPFGLGFRSSFFFSKQQLIEKHEAILASRIMQKIIQQPVTQKKDKANEKTENQSSPPQSLRSELIEIIENYSIAHEDKKATNENSQQTEIKDSLQAAKKNMLKYFDGGVLVDENLCIQERFFTEEKQNQNNEKQALNGSKSTDNSQNVKKLTFCPTYLVTGEVFRTVLSPKKYLLIKGHFGIGKTYSFMLYHLLSDAIYRYLHNHCKQTDSIIPQGINIKLPKLVYWNIDTRQMGQDKGLEIMNKIIADQCYELTDIEPNYQFFKMGNKQNLRLFYQRKNIRTRLIIDQINVIASALRDRKNCNLFEKQLKNKKYREVELKAEKDPSKKYQLDNLDQQNKKLIQTYLGSPLKIKERFNLAQQLHRMVGILTNKFRKGLFLSSRDIEESLLKELNLNGQHNHMPISQKNLKYESFSQNPQNLADLAQLFVFLLKIKFKQLSQQEITEEQNKIFQQIKQIADKNFETKGLLLLPFTMQLAMFQSQATSKSQAMSKSQASTLQTLLKKIFNKKVQQTKLISDKDKEMNDKSQKNQEKPRTLKENVDQLIQIINKKSITYLSELVDNFLDKSESAEFQKVSKEKNLLLLMLYYEVKDLNKGISKISKKENGNIIIDVKKIFNIQKIKQEMEITSKFSKHLGYYKEGKFVFTVNQKILLKILSAKESSLLETLLKLNADIQNLIQTQAHKGFYIESLLRACVSIPGTQMALKIQKNPKSIPFQPMTSAIYFFKSIPRKNSLIYNKFSFLESFKESITQAEYGRSFFYMPTAGDTVMGENKIDEASKKIDFILVQKISQLIRINAFDVTINMNGVQDKISEFFYEFSNFEDKEQHQIDLKDQGSFNVQLKYFVFVPNLLPDAIKWKQNIIGKAIQKLNADIEKIQKNVKDFTEELEKLKNQLETTKNSNGNEKTIKKINDNIKKLEDKIICSSQLIQRLQKRIKFLRNLSEDNNLNEKKSSLEISRSDKVKTLLTKVAVVSFKEAQFTNPDQGKLTLYKASLEKMKSRV